MYAGRKYFENIKICSTCQKQRTEEIKRPEGQGYDKKGSDLKLEGDINFIPSVQKLTNKFPRSVLRLKKSEPIRTIRGVQNWLFKIKAEV